MSLEIDFVIPWVDGNDPDWRQRKAQYSEQSGSDAREERYRDWGLLRYWFRGVEQFAPWVRKVFFICDQQPPVWLNLECEKLQVVRHEDYLPQEYRPTFSSHPIELNLHRIPGLSEHFVYFNDDMYLLRPLRPKDFFYRGLPCDSALLNPIPTTDLRGGRGSARIFPIPLNNVEYLNRGYDFRACVRRHPFKWLNFRYGKSLLRNLALMMWPRFVGFDEPHNPQSFIKSSFENAWEQDGDILDATSRHTFRDDRDVNQWLIREQQLANGLFAPCSPGRSRVFDLDRSPEEALRTLCRPDVSMVCLNDGSLPEEVYRTLRERLHQAFDQLLPNTSSFETGEKP